MKLPRRKGDMEAEELEASSLTIGACSGFIEVDPEAAKPKPGKRRIGFDLGWDKPQKPKKA